MGKIRILTHDKKFHTDEIFAIAILKKIYHDVEIIRSRNIKDYGEFDFIVDTGGEYNFEKKMFDHHQKGFNEKRKNGCLFSSCGLIWRHFGREIVNSEEAFNFIDKNLIEFIDAEDNGFTFSNGEVNIYSVGDIINSFNPIWNSEKGFNELFFEALNFAESVLDRVIEKANSISEGEAIVRKCLKESKEDFVILPKSGLPKRLILKNKSMKFMIMYPEKGKNDWASVAVPVEEKSFIRRKYFPKVWAGLMGDELEKVCGVNGAKFCHNHIFICVADSMEGIIDMTRKALIEE